MTNSLQPAAKISWRCSRKALAVIADSPSLPRREFAEALEIGRAYGFPIRVVKTDEFANPDYTANPSDRCYFCKSELFDKLLPLASEKGYQTILYGENASDDRRHGQVAESFVLDQII